MKDRHPIDDLFRDHLYDRDITYDPEAWKDAEKLLIDESKKRFFLYRFRYYLSALIVLITASVSIFLTGSGNNEVIIDNTELLNSELTNNKNSTGRAQAFVEEDVKMHNRDVQQDLLSTRPINSPVQKREYVKDDHRAKSILPNDGHGLIMEKEDESPLAKTKIQKTENPIPDSISYPSEEIEDNNLTASVSFEYMIPLSTYSQVENEPLKIVPIDPADRFNSSRHRFGLKAIAGIGITNKEADTEKSRDYGHTIFMGIGFERSVYKRISVEVDVIFSIRNAMGVQSNFSDKTYDFGYHIESTTYQFEKLYYTELPVMLNYHIGSAHHIGIGFQYAHLMTSRLTLNKTETSTTGDPVYESITKKASSDLFSPNDMSLKFTYQLSLSEQLNAGICYQYGLSNITSSEVSQSHNRNSQFRLMITYLILR